MLMMLIKFIEKIIIKKIFQIDTLNTESIFEIGLKVEYTVSFSPKKLSEISRCKIYTELLKIII